MEVFVEKEEKLRLFLERREELDRKVDVDLFGDEEAPDGFSPNDPDIREIVFFSEALVEFDLEIILEGIAVFHRTRVEAGDHGFLALALAKLGRVAEARMAADLIVDYSVMSRMDALIGIAYETGEQEDIRYAREQGRALDDPPEYASMLIQLAPIAPDAHGFVQEAREILTRLQETEDFDVRVASVLMRLADLTRLRTDLISVVRILNKIELEDMRQSSLHTIFEYMLSRIPDSKLALQIASHIRDPEWRAKYVRSINNRRRDLN